MSFGRVSAPAAPVVAPITDNSEELAAAAKLEAENLRKRKGMKSTWLTAGDDLGTATTQKAQLLGG